MGRSTNKPCPSFTSFALWQPHKYITNSISMKTNVFIAHKDNDRELSCLLTESAINDVDIIDQHRNFFLF